MSDDREKLEVPMIDADEELQMIYALDYCMQAIPGKPGEATMKDPDRDARIARWFWDRYVGVARHG